MQDNDHVCTTPIYVVNNESPVMTLSQTVDWGLRKLNIQALHAKGITGKGIKVAVLDTGVDLDHPDLKLAGSKDFTRSTPDDNVGHGTHVAGIIAAQGNTFGVLGGSPDVELYNYKVLGGNGGMMSDVAKAVRVAADDGMNIINMSLGSPSNAKFMEDACNYAKSKGVVIVVSSGNTGKDQKFYPSSYASCYATGAINKYFDISAFSTYGDQLEFVAPGEKVLSCYKR